LPVGTVRGVLLAVAVGVHDNGLDTVSRSEFVSMV
jgi:hypothetical protein